jgi:beta-galactosidase
LPASPRIASTLYQARWRPDLKFAHILPHWTWPGREGQVTPVHVFTSADEAELFVNGKSQGKQKRAPFEYRFRWDYVTYESGEVKVVTWKEGQPWATQTITTTHPVAALSVSADRTRIAGDGRDLAFVTVRVQDARGRTAPTASNAIRFTVSGPGELVATDNGDPTSFVPFPSATRPAFNGLALAIVRARPGAKGAITVRAQSDGLAAGTITLTTR